MTEIGRRHTRGDRAPQIGTEREHDVHAAGGHVGCPQLAKRRHSLGCSGSRLQVDLEEPVRMRALSEDPELGQDEPPGLAPMTLVLG
jgi:hypothetical protein